MYTPLAIANAFISRRPGITSVKANKLIWQFHGWALALGYELCSEQPLCWEFGPVYASAYDALRGFKGGAINWPVRPANGTRAPTIPADDTITWNLVDQVLKLYGDFTPAQLCHLAHRKGSPWDEAFGSKPLRHRSYGSQIPIEAMRIWFANLLADAHAAEANRCIAA